jgi:membrane protein implicated in regulation of membrane protease activity
MEDFVGDGKVWLEGEAWHARSQVAVTKDEQLIVTRLDGLTLDVEPVTKTEAPASD